MNSRTEKLIATIPLVGILLLPVVSLIAAHSRTKTTAPVPSANSASRPCHEAGYNAGTLTANGLLVAAFETPQGKIKVNLPDDMAPGDPISGTVNVEPAGNNQSERATNETELNGYVIDLGGQKKSVSVRMLALIIPTIITESGGVKTPLNGPLISIERPC